MSSDAAPVPPAQEPLAPQAPQSTQPPPKQDPIGLNGELDEFGLPIRKKPPRRLMSEASEENLRRSVEVQANVADVAKTGDQQDAAGSKPPAGQASEAAAESSPWEDEHAVKVNVKPVPSEALESPWASDKNAEVQETQPDILATAAASEPKHAQAGAVSEWSHQQMVPMREVRADEEESDDEWQPMPAYASYDMYNDDNRLIAREAPDLSDDDEVMHYGALGGAGKGYTRVQIDDDAESATSMDDNTAYLFKGGKTTNVVDDDEEARDPLAQMQATKDLLTEGQRIAYVGVVKLSMVEMIREADKLERTRPTKKQLDLSSEAVKMWGQKMMVRLYSHMEIESAEQIMIEQLGEHGVQPSDLCPALMQNARVRNPVAEDTTSGRPSVSSPRPSSTSSAPSTPVPGTPGAPPPYEDHAGEDMPEVRTPSQLPTTKNIDIDLRWTILCDLFLVLIADSIYDARSRQLLENVGKYLEVPILDICRFEKRVTDALEMQEAANDQNWNDEGHLESRKKMQKTRRMVMMGLATVGGSLVIGLSAGLLAPVIGAGLAAGFTTIGVAGTSSFLAGAGGAAIITTTGVVSGGTVGVRASNRRTGAVKTFEYRPLHNNKRVNMIITVSGWMNGKIDDVRLPFSTVDPVMGDMYSVFWEPEMLQSMGDTINILATEVGHLFFLARHWLLKTRRLSLKACNKFLAAPSLLL